MRFWGLGFRAGSRLDQPSLENHPAKNLFNSCKKRYLVLWADCTLSMVATPTEGMVHAPDRQDHQSARLSTLRHEP